MSISFQLIELPEDEQVTSRQVSLPNSGGTIGRSFECDIQLPDFARQLSRVHAEVMAHPEGGYQIIDRSVNGVYVNGMLLGKGGTHRLNDGDNVRMGAYTLLFSDMNALFSSKEATPSNAEMAMALEETEATFDRDKVLDPFNDALTGQEDAFAPASDPLQPEAPTFSSDNVLGEDVYGYDPFEDDEKWVMDSSPEDETDNIVMYEDDDSRPRTGRGLALANTAQVEALESSIERLNQIIEQQQKVIVGSVDRDRLMASIESSLEKFLDELDPAKLEEEFDDYITGWGRKDRKYWQLYRKQFARKKERRDFYRKFSALLFEELREKR